MFFDRVDRPEIAATMYGTSTHFGSINQVINLAAVVDRMQAALGEPVFGHRVATGAAMGTAEAVQYAHSQIQLARSELPDPA